MSSMTQRYVRRFVEELVELQQKLAKYAAMLGKMAGVEDDLLLLEQVSDQSG